MEWIGPYMKTLSAYSCPGAARSDSKSVAINYKGDLQTIKAGYGYNEYIMFSWVVGWDNYAREGEIRRTTHVLLVADCYRNALVNDWNDHDWLDNVDHFPTGMNRVRYADIQTDKANPSVVVSYDVRHGAPNILFCDLHVRMIFIDAFVYQNGGALEWPVVCPKARKP